VVVPTPIPSRVPEAINALPRRRAQLTQSLYSRYLPGIYQDNDFLQRFLSIFEDVWEPLEQRQNYIHMYFDPRTCPVSFLPWLASWLGLSFNPHWPEARRRRLLAQAMDLYRWRGTRYGLIRIIEVCTGLTPVIIENPLEPFVFRIRITATAENAVDKDLIEELIRTHKPAHAGYILEVI
jgi:phage tail-like protein